MTVPHDRPTPPARPPAQRLQALELTRRTLHGIAEHLLAGYQYRVIRRIALRVRPDGFSCLDLPPADDSGPTRLEVVSAEVIRQPGGRAVAVDGQSLGDLAAQVGIPFGLPAAAPYRAASGCGPDHPARLDPVALEELTRAWSDGDAALRLLAADHQRQDPPEPVLWPEHFDVALTLDEVNFGVSPGDAFLPVPYAYVGPWTPRSGAFWNAPFGAAVAVDQLGDAAGVLEFFRAGRRRAEQDVPAGGQEPPAPVDGSALEP